MEGRDVYTTYPLGMRWVRPIKHSLNRITDGVYSSGTLPAGKVVTIRLWGFAGMTSCADPRPTYEEMVKNIVEAIPPTAETIVVHFDGDAAYEKKAPKFSHNLFLPWVAYYLRQSKSKLPIHLVISKVDYDTTTEDLLKKFCDVEGGTYRLRVNPTKDAHSYPGHDAPFGSVTILTKALPKPEVYPPTEMINQTMVEDHIGRENIAMRACICIGGNTENGIKTFPDEFFDNVQRAELEAYA